MHLSQQKWKMFLLSGLLIVLLMPVISYFVFRFGVSAESWSPELLWIQNGDLILRRGRSIESYAVFLADKNRDYSHIGIVVCEHDTPYVVHAVPGESTKGPELVKKELIKEFLRPDKVSHFAVYRSRYSVEELKKVSAKALDFYRNKIEFDNDYDLSSCNRLYCSELVLRAYLQTDFDIRWLEMKEIDFVFEKKEILLPGNFVRSPQFFMICSY